MTRVVTFSDGFSSASAPMVSGAVLEEYTILNNQAAPVNFTGLIFTGMSSVFADVEVERVSNGTTYRQQLEILFYTDGTNWFYNLGNYQGSDLIRKSPEVIALPEEIRLFISNTGQVSYESGNLPLAYTGTFKISSVRITA